MVNSMASLIFITYCNHFLKFVMRFEQVFLGFSSIFQWLHVLISEDFLLTNDLFKISILAIDFQQDSSQDSLKTMAKLI